MLTVSAGPTYRLALALAATCGVSTLLAYLLESSYLATHLLYSLAYVSGSWFAARKTLGKLRHGEVDVDFLMLFVAVGAATIDAHREGAILLFLFSLSSALELLAEYRTHKEISSLYRSYPKEALKKFDETWRPVAVETLMIGDFVLVKPGELFPTDGSLVEGQTTADESALTGESAPVEKGEGSAIYGGTLNQAGQAVVRVTRLPAESAVQKIVRLIETAQKQKAPSQRFTDVISRYYTRVILAGSVLMFVILTVGLKHPLNDALYRTMVLLVVASPCALVLSVPSAILAAIASGARRGVLFRGGVAVEKLAAINHLAFDKTGTLTKGALRVNRILALNGFSENELLQLAASIEEPSTHPLARAVVKEARERGMRLAAVSEVHNSPGMGIEGVIDKRKLYVGSPRFLEQHGIRVEIAIEGTAPQVLIADDKLMGVVTFEDELRADAESTTAKLKAAVGELSLLSGDRHYAAKHVAERVNIRSFRAELSPADKLREVQRLQAEGKKVAMVGDGINDSPSLAAADVAIVMGERGSDTALEQADVVLMGDRISALAWAFQLSRRARRIIFQNIAISLGVICLLVFSAISQSISLTTGVFGHEGSTVAVVINSLRLLRRA